jgi:hypothetical protein
VSGRQRGLVYCTSEALIQMLVLLPGKPLETLSRAHHMTCICIHPGYGVGLFLEEIWDLSLAIFVSHLPQTYSRKYYKQTMILFYDVLLLPR